MNGRAPTPHAGRFAKGRSGNPAGRPKRPRAPSPSAFDIIIDRTLTITQGGHSREVTIDEALQHKTYQAAIAGSRLAQRAVMKMIDRRELARVAKHPPRPAVVVRRAQPEPSNADAALLLLDITQMHTTHGAYPAAKLTTWAVEAALARRRGGFTREELDDARRHALAPGDIRWPGPTEP